MWNILLAFILLLALSIVIVLFFRKFIKKIEQPNEQVESSILKLDKDDIDWEEHLGA